MLQTFVETLTYTPFAMCSFYFTMSLLESKPFNEAVAEVEAKFLPTYKVIFEYCIFILSCLKFVAGIGPLLVIPSFFLVCQSHDNN